VTVLFADVVHSMDIAAAVGPERLREIMSELLDRSTAVVTPYGGTLSQFTGDGIMAVFGAPITLEDHAVRACLAALGVQEEAKRLALEVHDRDGVQLQLRVGLNSGQVIAGEIGSGSLGYTAVGEQVGMAQRMESVAPPGGVLLSASPTQLVDGAAALGEAELVHATGADKPVAAYRLLGIGDRHRAVGCAESNLVDLTGDHLTGVQPHTQVQVDPVAVLDFSGQSGGLILNAQRRKTSADCVALQGHRRTKHGHDAVSGELVHRASVPLHHRRAAGGEVGHDLAQPLRTHCCRDVHRTNNIGEQHRHLLVLRRCGGGRDRRAALVAEP
jgi:class 3 adenylate cyclase